LSVQAASRLADEILFPTANEVDALPILPRERLDLLAEGGWYGLSAPSSGLDFASAAPILEAFAGGCLTTTFVWMQHLGTPPACAFGPEHLRPWVERLASGERRSTVAFGGLLPNPPLRAREDGEEWIVDGVAPWVSGWGLSDLIHVAARTPDDDVVWLLIDAPSPGMRAQPLRLLAVNASATVTLHFDGVRVDRGRETSRFPWADWPSRDAMGLRTNGSVALGVAARCCRLIGPSRLDEALVARRAALDAGTPDTMPAARAAAAAFAVQAASALVAHEGSAAVVVGNHAERLLREATVLLVFGSRPSIKRELLRRLGVTGAPS
jgi:alkylation response protein AidB-like acyl-CoA dehydrogenase